MADAKQSSETELSIDAPNTEKFPSSVGTPSENSDQITQDIDSQLIGSIFEGKYRIEGKLGEGGMGVVYRATHTLMERPVAIKFLHSDRLADSAAVERFKREARAAGRIQHPNATAVLDFGIANNIFYLVMEYLEGRTLRDRLREEGPLSFKETVRIVSQACKAVEAAHKCNVIHRDLKPDNIFLQLKDGVETVKVLDFGIAKITQGGSSVTVGVTTDVFMGTPHYMSPEQCQAESLTPASDIYSLGVIVFEMLTGKLPFKGNSLLSIALKHLNEPPPSLREFRSDIPEAAEAVIMRALSKDPKDRQQSALLLAEELRQAVGWSSGPTFKSSPTVTCSNPQCAWPKPSDDGRCLSCQALLVGALVRHRYEVRQMVGRGGFGITYLVNDQDCLDEARILKELRSEQPSDEENEEEEANVTAKRLFKREAQVLLNLQHPGIPKLYAYFIEGEYSYLVQDFIPGQTLLEEVEERKRLFDEQEARAVLAEIADILEYLHSCTPPIVHRDIKPQNLMRHSSGRLLLIDFGAVCQAVSSGASGQTLIGSPGYAPPEQIFGHPVPQSDLYAAGATVLRLLTGTHPSQLFNNKTQRMEWESRVKVSPQFAAVLNDLLIQNAKKRLGSATELKRRLVQNLTAETMPAVTLAPVHKRTLEPVAPPTSKTERAQTSGVPMPKIVQELTASDSQLYRSTKPPDEVGKLEQMPILFLLRRFYRERLSGLLTCINNNVTKNIHFDHGAVVFANSTLASERLSEMLIRTGRISAAELEQATAIMKSRGLRFGSALIEMGCMTLEELKPFVISQVSDIIYSLFDWTAGQYEVRQERLPEESIKISVSTADVIFEGLRRVTNIDLVKRWIGDFTRKLTTTTDPLLLYQAVNLNPKEAFIVSRIASVMSVEEILSMGGLPEAETLKTLCGLLAVGILEWVEKDEKLARPIVPVANLLAGTKTLPSDFDIQTAATFCYEVENLVRIIDSASHYAVLGVERNASEEQIREAYTRMARRFHPDRNTQLANYNMSLRSELEKIFARISEAYRVLGDRMAREEYDYSFRSSGKIKIPSMLTDTHNTLRTPSGSETKKPPKKR